MSPALKRSAGAGLLGFLLGVLSLSFKVGNEIHIPLGSASGPLMMSGLGPSEVVLGLPQSEVSDERRDFYFRKIDLDRLHLSLPLRPRGPFSFSIRMDSTVRTKVDLLQDEQPLGGAFVLPGPWAETVLAESVPPESQELALRLEDAPLVRRSDVGNFRRYVDEIVIRSDQGFELPGVSRITGGLAVLFLVLMFAAAAPRVQSTLVALIAAGTLSALLFTEPVAVSLALPRLLGFVVAGAALVQILGRRLSLDRSALAFVVLLASLMIFTYGFISFLPNHSPADLDIHIWRTLDLARVPMTYEGWHRYGSHYPTPSQVRGSATDALGEGPAIPYSPLPYTLFFAAHAAGLDLHWSMNAIEAVSLALLLPLIFALAQSITSADGGRLACTLMSLDLATIHHLGRAHSPAVVGGALGVGCLLAFGLALPRLDRPWGWRVPALLLGIGALGYSSTPLFYALFGITILVLLLSVRDTRTLVRPAGLALALGGAIALVLFYGHYLPGLFRSGQAASPVVDSFPGRTFFIFHNESRQSLRLWRLGLFIPYLATLPALALVARRISGASRTFLLAWLSAWAGIMLLKEPWGLPVLLRWAKEDIYVSPAIALVLALGVTLIDSRFLRIAIVIAVVTSAAYLRGQDYGFHADTMRFLK